MSEAVLTVAAVGSHVTIQDAGRAKLMRFGVPASGPMDRISYAAANIALGNKASEPAIEISTGGLALECQSGTVSFAVAGGGFNIEYGSTRAGAWLIASIRAGERLLIRPGSWGSWAYLSFAGHLVAKEWLGSVATHAPSGFGGGCLRLGQQLIVAQSSRREDREGEIPRPMTAAPRSDFHVVLGPQERFFSGSQIGTLLSQPFWLTDAYDRMGVRLRGPSLVPQGRLDMPSEAVLRGAVQVAGDGVATILLADHQTTGGYPKIATVLGTELDSFVQLRARDEVSFSAISAEDAIEHARARAMTDAQYFAAIGRSRGNLSSRLLTENLISGVVDGATSQRSAR